MGLLHRPRGADFEQYYRNNISYLNKIARIGKVSIDILEDLFTDSGISPIIIRADLDTYSSWTHVMDESGFSIWKYAVSNFSDNADNMLYSSVSNNVENLSVPYLYEYMGAAAAEDGTYFDYIYTYDDPDWSSNLGGASGDLQDDTNYSSLFTDSAILYIGDASIFSAVYFNLALYGAGLADNWTLEYWSGAAWTEVTELMGLNDGTENFTKHGSVKFDSSLLTGWATTSVNGQSAYWVRFSATTGTRYPSAYLAIPGDTVQTMLHLSLRRLNERNYPWCYYNGYVYIPILNNGDSGREGISWITNSSTNTDKQRFFELYNIISTLYFSSAHPGAVSNRVGSSTLDGTTGVAITHNLGHTNYIAGAMATGGTARAISVTKASNSVTFYSTAGVIDAFDYWIREM